MEGGWEDRGISVVGDDANQGEQPQGGIHEVEQHPLLMPTVMSVLFQQMSRKKLANCRLVCREWFNGSLSLWRSKFSIKFKYQWTVDPEDGSFQPSVKEFHKFWEDDENKCGVKPFQRFKIVGSLYWHNLELDRPFWGRIGGSMTHLTLMDCSFTSITEFRELMYNGLPNLQYLHLKSCWGTVTNSYIDIDDLHAPSVPYKEPEFGEHAQLKTLYVEYCLPDNWMNLLSHFTALDNIIVDVDRRHLPILEVVKTIRKTDPRKLPLKQFKARLSVNMPHPSDEVPAAISYGSDLIRQLRIPLACIHINSSYGCHGINHHSVKNILQLHSETITYMSLAATPDDPCLEFPVGLEFPNLEKVRMSGRAVESFHFLKCMPNLRDLRIEHYERDAVPFQPHYMFSNSLDLVDMNPTRIFMLSLDFTVSDDDFKCLMKWMPRVRRLGMNLNARQIQLANIGNIFNIISPTPYRFVDAPPHWSFN